jgi:hypothetical protein
VLDRSFYQQEKIPGTNPRGLISRNEIRPAWCKIQVW